MSAPIPSNSALLDTAAFAKRDRKKSAVFGAHQITAATEVYVSVSGALDMALIIRQAMRILPTATRIMVLQTGVKAVIIRSSGFWKASAV